MKTQQDSQDNKFLSDPSSPMECTEQESERWNAEWLRYLGREWRRQLKPHTEYAGTPTFPSAPEDCLEFRVGGAPIDLYCDGPNIVGKRVMEMGCGCGNLGKLLGRYVEAYVGTDYSPLALMVARLVSPDNCAYVHVGDKASLEPLFSTIDTVVSRHFWIHQSRKLARMNLEFLQLFLKPGGILYTDFCWPDPAQQQFKVFAPGDSLSAEYPSARFKYTEQDIAELIVGTRFRTINQDIHTKRQVRYVTFELGE